MCGFLRFSRLAVLIVLCMFVVPSLVSQISDAQAQTEAIEWSNKKLKWDDFKGTAPDPLPTDLELTLQAEITVDIGTSWSCDEEGKLTFDVQASMEPDESWATADAKKDAHARKHEQGHFDLAEVFARKLRTALGELNTPPCDEEAINKLIDTTLDAHDAEQKKYDSETKHGTDKEKQKEWRKSIDKQLKELKAVR